MRRRSVLAMAAGLAATGAGAGGLARYRWRNRVVVVFCPPGDPRAAAQAQVLARLSAGGDDRDLVLVRVEGDRVDPPLTSAEALRHDLHVRPDGFTALLVGKDGGVKLREGRVLDADVLRDTIDAMPMRRDEMSRRSH